MSLMDMHAGKGQQLGSGSKGGLLSGGMSGDAAQMKGSKFEGSLSGSYGQNRSIMKGIQESPARRYRKPEGEGKILSELLGAGVDPLDKIQEYSMMASSPGELMNLNFKRPAKANVRYPPVIDPFSRTLAAPISS